MNKHRQITLIVAGLISAFIVGAIIWAWPPSEPQYQGKGVSEWCDKFVSRQMNARQEAEEAFKALGTEAVPFLVYLIERQETGLDKWYKNTYHKTGTNLSQWLPKPRDIHNPKHRALLGLKEIGTNAVDALPALIRAVDEQHDLRPNLAHALGAIAPNSHLEAEAVAALIRATKDSVTQARQNAYYHLSLFPNQVETVLPVLIEGLKDKKREVGWSASTALGRLGVQAKTAIPALLDYLNKAGPLYSGKAMEALKQIDPEAAAKAGNEIMDSGPELERQRRKLGAGNRIESK